MTECGATTNNVGHVGGGFAASEVTFFDMVATAAYRMVGVVETALQRYSTRVSTMWALDRLQQLDDRHLADMGISREDLTVEGLVEAAARRERVIAAMRHRA